MTAPILLAVIVGCSAGQGASPSQSLVPATTGVAGASAVANTPIVPGAAPAAVPAPLPTAAAGAMAVATTPVAGINAPPVGGMGGSGVTPATGSTDASHPPHTDGPGDPCMVGHTPDARDAQLTGMPDEWRSPQGDVDLVVPQPVLDWMTEHLWQRAHEDWHALRACRGPARPDGICSLAPQLIAKDQVCTNASDGLQFLAMHRHMLQGLRQAFPQHRELFSSFTRFPAQAADVPEQWRARFEAKGGFAPEVLAVGTLLEDIENNLDMFASEGDLGRYIQCGMSDLTNMAGGPRPGMPLHVALHNQFIVSASPHSVGNGKVNIENFMFWKLHGWIDDIWQRYRHARGLPDDEPALKEIVAAQCREMEAVAVIRRAQGPGMDTSSSPTGPLPTESGFFHERVRPIFEKTCRGCHDASGPEASLVLAGNVSSADIIAKLVNQASRDGGQFQLVVPGAPDKSWLYLKPAGMAQSAGCTGMFCNTQVMPPAGRVTVPQAELDALRQWILDGAQPPPP